jgi:hypothetical protein
LPLFVKLFLQLADLLELHSLIGKELSLVPAGGVLDMRWRVPSSGQLLFLRIRRAFNVDVEALAGWIVGVVGRVGVGRTEIII